MRSHAGNGDGRERPRKVGHPGKPRRPADVNLKLKREIAQRERVERSLRESEAHARAVLDTAVDAIITIDPGGVMLSFNPAAERLFGYRADEAVGRNVSMLRPSTVVPSTMSREFLSARRELSAARAGSARLRARRREGAK